MYGFYLVLEWLGHHPIWTGLGLFVLIATIAISWYFDSRRIR